MNDNIRMTTMTTMMMMMMNYIRHYNVYVVTSRAATSSENLLLSCASKYHINTLLS